MLALGLDLFSWTIFILYVLSRDFYLCNNGLLVWDWTTIGQRWDVSPGCMPQ